MKYILAKGTNHEFIAELPFKSFKELKRERKKFKIANFPNRNIQSPCYEFYLQYLPKNYTVDDIRANHAHDLDYFIRTFGEEIGHQKYKNRLEKDKIKGTLPAYISRYGEEEGTKKYYLKNAKLSVSDKSLKLNGFNDTEIKEIKETQRKKSANTLSNFINRYGNEIGINRYENYLKNHRTQFGLIYWIEKGISEEDAKVIVSDLQRRDLNYFEQKYGKEEGTVRYKKSVKGRIAASNTGAQISKLETICYEEIRKIFPDAESSKVINKYVVDVFVPSLKCVIEIYGDYWHCNPKFWKPDQLNRTFKLTAQQKWDKDEKRLNIIKESGVNVICIWENDINEKGIIELLKSKIPTI